MRPHLLLAFFEREQRKLCITSYCTWHSHENNSICVIQCGMSSCMFSVMLQPEIIPIQKIK